MAVNSETLRRISNAQRKISNSREPSFPPVTNQDRLKMARASIQNLVQANKQDKLEKKKKASTSSPDILKLQKQILAAASGKPLKTSITKEMKDKELAEQAFIFSLLQKFNGTDEESQGDSGKSGGRTDAK